MLRWLWLTLYAATSILSRSVNALFFRGTIYRTLSAALHLHAHDDPRWRPLRDWVDWLFGLFQDYDHCASSWEKEVARARKTLATQEKIDARKDR